MNYQRRPLFCAPGRPALLLLTWLSLLFACIAAAAAAAAPAQAPVQNTNCLVITRVVFTGNFVCSDNNGNLLSPPEYDTEVRQHSDGLDTVNSKQIQPAVFLRGTSPTVTFTLYRPRGLTTYNGNLSFAQCLYAGSSLPYSPSSQSISIGAGQYATVTFTVGPLPDMVMPRRALSLGLMGNPQIPIFQEYLSHDPGGLGFEDSSFPDEDDGGFRAGGICSRAAGFRAVAPFAQVVYLVYDTPKSPQTNPWLGVLDDACAWAQGENTYDGVAAELTLGMFWGLDPFFGDPRFFYTGQAQYSTSNIGYPVNLFDLKRFLAASYPPEGNCHDVSNYLSLCMDALGLDSYVAFRGLPNGNVVFTTNPLLLIGYALFGEFTTIGWWNHQITYSRLTHPTNGAVYDACLALETDPDGVYRGIWADPATGQWLYNYYWQNVQGNVASGVFALTSDGQPIPPTNTAASKVLLPPNP